MSKNIINSRKIIYFGCGEIPIYRVGTKVTFHFKTVKLIDDSQQIVIDDSKKCGKPMELIIGKKFKLILWEEWIQNMRVNEVSQIIAPKDICITYPFVSKCYRKFCHKSDDQSEQQLPHHCCGMSVNQGLGHKDLDQLVENPCDLKFTIELLKVETPEEYEKEIWQMSSEELLESIPKYREEGNDLYSKKMYSESALMYSKALAIIEQLLLNEKPGDEDWLKLDKMKIPLLSNLSQCKLIERDFYAVIEHTTQVIKRDELNVKAFYRRAKANFFVWNLDNARNDFKKVIQLDHSLHNMIKKELQSLDLVEKEKNEKDMSLLKGKLFT